MYPTPGGVRLRPSSRRWPALLPGTDILYLDRRTSCLGTTAQEINVPLLRVGPILDGETDWRPQGATYGKYYTSITRESDA